MGKEEQDFCRDTAGERFDQAIELLYILGNEDIGTGCFSVIATFPVVLLLPDT